MNFALTEEQKLIRDSARNFLSTHLPTEKILKNWESADGYDVELWQKAIDELGWSSAFVSEKYGGLGLGMVEAVLLAEEMGRVLFSPPLLASIFLCANLIEQCGSDAHKENWLPQLAAGAVSGTAAIYRSDVMCEERADGYRLSGHAPFVLEGAQADVIIIAAKNREAENNLFLLPKATEGLSCKSVPTMDRCLRRAHLHCDKVLVPTENKLPQSDFEQTFNKALIVFAGEQLGGAAQSLDLTLEYTKARVQFGRTISSFQAVKHKCADMMIGIESARSAVYYAAALAQSDAPNPSAAAAAAAAGGAAAAAALAKATCSDVFFECAAQAMQLHGGISFTWDYVLHLYFKHARASQSFWGSADLHREKLASMIGFDGGELVWI